jgi:hypothetical protein
MIAAKNSKSPTRRISRASQRLFAPGIPAYFQHPASSFQILAFYSTHPGGSIPPKPMKTIIEKFSSRHTHHILQALYPVEGRCGTCPDVIGGSAIRKTESDSYLLCAFCIPNDFAGRRFTRARWSVCLPVHGRPSEQKSKGEEKANRYTWKLEIR